MQVLKRFVFCVRTGVRSADSCVVFLLFVFHVCGPQHLPHAHRFLLFVGSGRWPAARVSVGETTSELANARLHDMEIMRGHLRRHARNADRHSAGEALRARADANGSMKVSASLTPATADFLARSPNISSPCLSCSCEGCSVHLRGVGWHSPEATPPQSEI